MNKAYLTAKKVHRVTMIAFLFLGTIMAFTGIFLRYFRVAAFLNIDLVFIRDLHSTTSTVFVLVLAVMGVSGVAMYVAPLIKRKSQNPNT